MKKRTEKTGDEAVLERFSDREVLLMQAMLVTKFQSLDAAYLALEADTGAALKAPGLKKAFSTGRLTHKGLATVARLLQLPPDEVAFRVRRGAGLIPLGESANATVPAATPHAKELAYRVWVQLYTRVVGYPINWDTDDLAKVYDSWYEAFRRIRGLTEEAALWRDPDAALASKVLKHVTDLLNGVLRPHLTHHQSYFRQWLNGVAAKNRELQLLSMQERQKKYPEFGALRIDFETAQKRVKQASETLYGLVFPQASQSASRRTAK